MGISDFGKSYLPYIVVSVIILAMHLCSPLNIYDEGLVLSGGKALSQGQLPYADFWTVYPVGVFFISSLSELFGVDAFVFSRIITFFLYLSTSIIIYLALSQIKANLHKSIIVYISLLLTLLPSHLSALGLAVAVCAKLLYYLYIFFKKPSLYNAFVPSLIIGFLSLYRHDFAFLLSGMVFQTFGFYIIFQVKEKGYWKIGLKNFIPYVIVYLLGLLPAILVWLYIVQVAGFSVVKDLLFDIPLEVFADYRALPFPMPWDFFYGYGISHSLGGIIYLLTYLTFFASGIYYIFCVVKKRIEPNSLKFWQLVTLFNIALNLLNYSYTRSDLGHLAPAIVFITSLLFVFIDNMILPLKRLTKSFFTISFFIVSTIFIKNSINTINLGFGYKENQQVIDFIKHNYPNASIYSGVNNHDQFLINDVSLYFFLDQTNNFYYRELHTGIVTTDSIQSRIVNDLEEENIKIAVIIKNSSNEENESSFDHNLNILDNHILLNYIFVKQIGNYNIYRSASGK